MTTRKTMRKHPIPVKAIKKEIRAAAKRLHALEEKAAPGKLKNIKLELKILTQCYRKLGNIVDI